LITVGLNGLITTVTRSRSVKMAPQSHRLPVTDACCGAGAYVTAKRLYGPETKNIAPAMRAIVG